jgi:capsular exopolysaccharide synthesis family protein
MVSLRRSRLAGAASAEVREEAFRIIRSSLEVATMDNDGPVAMMVTSANAGEGKTSTAVHLARAFAGSGRRVVLVDLDLRHPDAHRRVGAHNDRGVTDVLLDQADLATCLQFIEVDSGPGISMTGFYFLAAGHPPSNPAELLGTARTTRLLDAIAEQADLVIIDSPPVLPVADALVIGRLATGVVLVAEARATTYPQLQRAVDVLKRGECNILGVILNKQRVRDDLYGYGYGPTANGQTVSGK